MNHNPPDDAAMLVITIMLPEGTDVRVKITQPPGLPAAGDARTGAG